MLIRPPRFLKKIYPSFIWNFPEEKDGVFLTFDDGPCEETLWILDQLEQYHAKATFFCIGKNVELHPDIFAEVLRRGHAVGVHSYSHRPGWGVPLYDYIQDVDMAADLIKSDLYRPPYAKITPVQAEVLGRRYRIVMWNILSRDYNRSISPRCCAKNVVPYLRPGSIVVFHDSLKASVNMRYALLQTLDAVYAKNMNCKSVIIK